MPMRTLSVISQKGGVGKTTLVTALAVAAASNRRQTAVLDLDPQASATFWKDTRGGDNPAVTSIQPSRLPNVLASASKAGCELAIVDAPPFAKDIAYEAAQCADFVLIPTRPAVFDVMAMTRTLELIRHFGRPAAVILTMCPSSGRELADTETAVQQLGAELCPVRIHNRIAYSRAQQTGLVAQELEPGSKAADEIMGLYTYICKKLYPRKEVADAKPEKLTAGRARPAGRKRTADASAE